MGTTSTYGLGGDASGESNITDDTSDAVDIQEGGNDYINIDTTDGNEVITIGNTTTNPNTDFVGSGPISMGDSVDIGAGAPTVMPLVVKSNKSSGISFQLQESGAGTSGIVELGQDGGGGWMQVRDSGGTVVIKLINSGSSFVNGSTSKKFGIAGASPASTLDNFGDVGIGGIANRTSSFTAGAAHIYTCDTTSGNMTVTLPEASDSTRRCYCFKKTVAANDLIINPWAASEAIDGLLSKTLSSQYDSVTIYCDGSKWHIID